MSVLNCLIINSDKLIAEHYTNKSYSELVMERIFPKLSNENCRTMLTHKTCDFYYKKQDDIIVFCVGEKQLKMRIAWKCVDEIYETYGIYELNKNMRLSIRKIMEKWNNPESDQILVLNHKIDEVKDVMIKNIDKILERGDKLDEIVIKAEEINVIATDFSKITQTLRNSMCKKLAFLIILLYCFLYCIFIVLVFLICDFPSFSRCIPSK